MFSLSNKRLEKIILIFLLFTAAILYAASCCKYVFMDESITTFTNVIHFIKEKTIIPIFVEYPTFFSYLAIIPTCIGALILYIGGILPSIFDITILAQLDSILPYLPARIISAIFGLATILLLFNIGQTFFTRQTGLIAAVFIVFSKLYVHRAGYALPDMTMIFLVTCSLFFSLKALESKKICHYVMAGVFAGIATSTKYNGVMAVIPIVTVYLITLFDEKRNLVLNTLIVKPVIFAGLGFACAFFIGSPGWLLNPSSMWDGFVWQYQHINTGRFGGFGIPYIHYLKLFWNWEKTTAILFGLGLIYAIFRHSRKDIVLLTFILISFFYIGNRQAKSLHYLLFLYPTLSLLSARVLSKIFSILNKNIIFPKKYILFAIVIIFMWPAYSTFGYAYQQTKEDNRWISQKWIQKNIPEGTRIVVDWAYIPKLITEKSKVEWLGSKHKVFAENSLKNVSTYELVPLGQIVKKRVQNKFEYTDAYSVARLKEVEADYLITSSQCFDRFFTTPPPPKDNPLFEKYNNRKNTYEALFYKENEVGWKLLKEFNTGKGPRILIYNRIEKIN